MKLSCKLKLCGIFFQFRAIKSVRKSGIEMLQKKFTHLLNTPPIYLFTAEVDLPSDEQLKLLSVRLYNAMEYVDSNQPQNSVDCFDLNKRNYMKRLSEICEIGLTTLTYQYASVYVVGSQYEGSTNQSTCSDLDLAILYHYPTVVTEIQNNQSEDCLFLVENKQIPKGYCTLQQVTNGVRQKGYNPNWLDKERNPWLYHSQDNANRSLCFFEQLNLPNNLTWSGPAITTPALSEEMNCSFSEYTSSFKGLPVDNTLGLQCDGWPKCAQEWLTRERKHNWPSPDIIEKCKSLGFYVVGMGHTNSHKRHLQSKISFGLQERLLVSEFNSTQYKTYVLLKQTKQRFYLSS